jgi:hypothetical protein
VAREQGEGELNGMVSAPAMNSFPSPPVPPSGAPPCVMGEKKVTEEACDDWVARLRRFTDGGRHAQPGGGCRARGDGAKEAGLLG